MPRNLDNSTTWITMIHEEPRQSFQSILVSTSVALELQHLCAFALLQEETGFNYAFTSLSSTVQIPIDNTM